MITQKLPLSVVVIARNEESNIVTCLSSVHGWVDEILVVDDNSTDRTPELAREYAEVVTRKMDNEGRHRNWAYARARNEWVFSLDADEVVSLGLKDELGALFVSQMSFDGYTIPRRNHIGTYWVRYGGEYPAAQLRLFRKEKFRFEEVGVHPRAFLQGACGHLKGDIFHYSWEDLADVFNRVNSQSTLEAQKWIQTGRRMWAIHALWRAGDRFIRKYIMKKGYKDGVIGFIMAYKESVYQLLSWAKHRELLMKTRPPL
jgi:glycosyltransferase involved in cell wall biosynthesis